VSAPLLVVCAALIDDRGRVLLARRPAGKPMAGLWEFPGGKLQPDETPEAALARELGEELGIEIALPEPLAFASHAYAAFHVLLLLYLCRQWRGEAVAREGQSLAWIAPESLDAYTMPDADRPLVAALKERLTSRP
jgi:8-oxo-dGTP diphosphatase